MIDISKLTEDDRNRTLVYEVEGQEREWGLLSNWNERYVFVLFDGNIRPKATSPADLRFDLEE